MASKKILISSISVLGSAVAVTAVATPIAVTNGYTQSASTDVGGDDNSESGLPGTSTNPGTSEGDSSQGSTSGDSSSGSSSSSGNTQAGTTTTTVVNVASTDTFVANLGDRKINYDIARDDATLNAYLSATFIMDGVETHLTNSYDSHVTLSYDYNSADYETMTFKVNATLEDGYSFTSNATENVKVITVTIPTDDIDSTLYTSSVPETDTYLGSLTYLQVSNSEMLDSYLFDEYSKDELTANLLNYFSYTDVSVVYVENSASYENNSFSLIATPTSGHAWSDGTDDSKEILVTIATLDKDVWDSTIGTTLSFSYEVSAATDTSLDSTLSTLFTDSTYLSYLTSNDTISNVDVAYVSGSASLSNSTFEVTVTPSNGHAWSDGTTSSVTMNVSLTNVTAKNIAAIPLGLKFSINAAGMFLSQDFREQINFSWVAMRSIGYNGLQQFYKYIDYVGTSDNYRSGYVTIAKSADGSLRNRVYATTILVQPKSGYTWSDGQTYQRAVTLYYFKTYSSLEGYSETSQRNVGNIAVEVTDGTINHWISNFIYAPTEADRLDTTTVATKVYNDLYETLSKIYWVDTKDSFKFSWITNGSNWDNDMTYGVYTFNIAPKNAPEKVKTITGYLFTANQSQLSFINSYFY